MIKKIKKYICITLSVILLIILPGWVYFQIFIYDRWGDREQFAKFALMNIMSTNLGLPSDRADKNRSRTDWKDLEPITYEEWMNVECESQYKGDKDDYNRSGKDFVIHTTCINPQYFSRYPNKNANSWRIFRVSTNKALGGMLDSPCTTISFNEYILKYPKILNNIIRIAEKPCFYLKHPDLYCDKARHAWYEAEKSCVIVRIIDSEGYTKMQIRIPRQDNKHLLKNQKEWEAMIARKKARIESYNKKQGK